MNKILAATLISALATPQLATAGGPPVGTFGSIDTLFAFQTPSEAEGGGEIGLSRGYLRAGTFTNTGEGATFATSLEYGVLDFEFKDTNELWNSAADIRLSAAYRKEIGEIFTLMIAPSLRLAYENGAELEESYEAGVFGAYYWYVNDRLTFGPALGITSGLGGDDVTIIPAFYVNWDISDQLTLSTGRAPGATRGPGLNLDWKISEDTTIGLAARYEVIDFRLDDDGSNAGGIGQYKNVPIVATYKYEPLPFVSVSAFAGVSTGGEVSLESSSGSTLQTTEFDTAPVFGGSFRVLF